MMYNDYSFCMNNELSNTKSKDTINTIVESSVVVTNKDISKDNLNRIVNGLNKPLRKCMHSFVFFILVILFINASNNSNIRNYKCYLFSIVFLSFSVIMLPLKKREIKNICKVQYRYKITGDDYEKNEDYLYNGTKYQ